MVKETSLCEDCLHVITNPLCPTCFTGEVFAWLRDRNLPESVMDSIGRGFGALLKEAEETLSNVDCVICASRKVNFCTYCFVQRAEEIIRESLGEGAVLVGFQDDFDTKILI